MGKEMKNIKPIYIYGAGIIIAALVFIFLSQKDASDVAKSQPGALNQQMPNDSIHKGLTGGMQPGKDNVMEQVKQHLAMLKKAVDDSPGDTIKIKQYADFLAAAHQQDEALVYYDKILNVNPKRIDILFSIAYIHYTKQEFSEAEKYLNKILSYDKNNVQAYYNLGAVAASKGDKAKAKEIWSKLIRDYPKAQISELAKKSLNEI
jgi:tetratricopeptide (TPR) repeat protein